MRTIKFRALKDDMSNVNFMYGQLVYDAIGQPRITEVDRSGKGLTFHTCLKGTEGQYTGLKDKNGVEIYEGDVIQYKSYHVNKRWWSNIKEIDIIKKECEKQRKDIQTVKNVVTFDKGGFILNYPITFSHIYYGERLVKGQTHSCDTEEKQWDFEVIGNIHENPELL